MSIEFEEVEHAYESVRAWDITDATLMEVVAWVSNLETPGTFEDFVIEYHHCGSHEVILKEKESA